MPMYYTSKAFIFSLSQACAKETEDTGVVIACLCPGPAATNFEKESQMKTDNRMFTWFGSEKLKRDLTCLVNTGKISGHILHSCTRLFRLIFLDTASMKSFRCSSVMPLPGKMNTLEKRKI